MTTCQDLINETQRLVGPTQRSITVTLSSLYTAGGSALSFTDLSVGAVNTGAIIPGVVLSIDLELFFVSSVAAGGVVNVVGGYLGSTPANHATATLVYISRKFTDFECLQQINHTLSELGGSGLYNLASMQLSYNPVIQAYDLTDVVTSQAITGYIDGVGIRYQTPLPDRKLRTIPANRWEVIAGVGGDSNFPSGYALTLNDEGWPGQNFFFFYKQSFGQFASYTDNAQTVGLLASTMNDLPPMGAMLRMVAPREIARNQMQTQPDSRLATEVTPGAIANSVAGVMRTYEARIGQEASRLKQQIGHFRRRH